jgi:hypothetical protein
MFKKIKRGLNNCGNYYQFFFLVLLEIENIRSAIKVNRISKGFNRWTKLKQTIGPVKGYRV